MSRIDMNVDQIYCTEINVIYYLLVFVVLLYLFSGFWKQLSDYEVSILSKSNPKFSTTVSQCIDISLLSKQHQQQLTSSPTTTSNINTNDNTIETEDSVSSAVTCPVGEELQHHQSTTLNPEVSFAEIVKANTDIQTDQATEQTETTASTETIAETTQLQTEEIAENDEVERRRKIGNYNNRNNKEFSAKSKQEKQEEEKRQEIIQC